MSITIRCLSVQFDQIAAILWDKDGTLADSHPFLQALAVERSQRVDQQVPGTGEALLAAFGCSSSGYDATGLMAVGTRYENEIAAAAYIAATGRSWTTALAIAQQAFADSGHAFAHKADLTPPFVGIAALLQKFHGNGVKQAVLSGDTTANIHAFLDRYDLTPWVQWSAGSEAPPIKPDPQMVWTACEQLGVVPEQCLVVGDSGHDGELGRRSGCRGFVSVTWGGSPAIATADVVINHPHDLHILNPTLQE